MKNHGNRPNTIFMSLNRRYRVIHRFGVYSVQRCRRDQESGKNTWAQMYNATPNLQRAIELCGGRGLPYTFIPGAGWV